MTKHIPVLLNEVMELMNPQSGENFIDGTLGGGGHSRALLKKIGPNGNLLAIDWNQEAIAHCDISQDEKNFHCLNGNFSELPDLIQSVNFPPANGILLDLGISSEELECSGRGFSFQKDEELLMTYNDSEIPVKQLLKELSEDELGEILKNLGEESYFRPIARAIKERQRKSPINTTQELVETIALATPRHNRLNPATKTFMALRIYANHELENLQIFLDNFRAITAPRARIAIISFHSLEDRIVKNHFRKLRQGGWGEPITKKPVTPSRAEIINNPRSRSAKLRVLQLK